MQWQNRQLSGVYPIVYLDALRINIRKDRIMQKRAVYVEIGLIYSAEIRKAIYTTNAIESLNMSLRKIIKTRGSFPSEEACLKLLYLGLKNVSKKWTSADYPTGD